MYVVSEIQVVPAFPMLFPCLEHCERACLCEMPRITAAWVGGSDALFWPLQTLHADGAQHICRGNTHMHTDFKQPGLLNHLRVVLAPGELYVNRNGTCTVTVLPWPVTEP